MDDDDQLCGLTGRNAAVTSTGSLLVDPLRITYESTSSDKTSRERN
jgi:hypothetical protein